MPLIISRTQVKMSGDILDTCFKLFYLRPFF
ncbi:hypothetical protein E4N76_08675 [Treponema putidum]|uniref:Uncharacterized protein n=1 Tax=Treponema putidum TaxID=221027 RepID=A0AAE9MSQ2_9SPIR|nr:hypothetical protein E4N76_08605 [Treponema putidum]UTY29042.1 hypothetical protein E4N76_08675 [Treponema putidum]UTY31439.1 hypothetical protein E4N75_08000 [Treponema putidum]UTY33884.1 hypothetical protein E4N74_07630 [Treponema putidum]